MEGDGNDNLEIDRYAGADVKGPLWVLIPRAAGAILLTTGGLLLIFWLVFGELPTVALVCSGSLAIFQALIVFGLRNAPPRERPPKK